MLILEAARQQRAQAIKAYLSSRSVRRTLPALGLLTAGIVAAAEPDIGTQGMAVVLAVFAASLASSVAGFAFSAICGAMLFHLVDAPVRVVEIMLICSIANQLLMTWLMRDSINMRALLPYLLGGIAGLPLGLYLLLGTSRAVYAAAFGALLISYSLYKMGRPSLRVSCQSRALEALMGVVGGVTGGAAAFPGAAVTIWCGCRGWDKQQQRAVYQPFILLMQVATVMALMALHVVAPRLGSTAPVLNPFDISYVMAGLIGTWYGLRCFARLNDRQFATIVNVMLMLSGLSFVL